MTNKLLISVDLVLQRGIYIGGIDRLWKELYAHIIFIILVKTSAQAHSPSYIKQISSFDIVKTYNEWLLHQDVSNKK